MRQRHSRAACRSPFSVVTLTAVATVGAALPCQDLRWRELQQSTHTRVPMVHDGVRNRFVAISDGRTLEWDGLAWRERATLTPAPARIGALACFDTVRGRTVLFGGFTGSNVGSGTPWDSSLWEYDGADWRSRPTANGPSGRHLHAMAYDSRRGVLVLYGGAPPGQAGGHETWEWDGTTWTLAATVGPTANIYAAMAYHASRDNVVLFGGADANAFVPVLLNETWTWDGTTWTQRAPAVSPMRRSGHAMTFDPTKGRVLMFGGPDSQLWEWTGLDWIPGPSAPAPRSDHGMATSHAGRTMLLGGFDAAGTTVDLQSFGDTWMLERGRWRQATASGPTQRGYAMLTYDNLRDRVVLAGGSSTNHRHTWEWDGVRWFEIAAPVEPPLFGLAKACFDSQRGVVVQFGGFLGFGTPTASTWEWNGATWTSPTPAQSPPSRFRHAMVFDSARGVAMLFGGTGATAILGDTWLWDGVNWTQAATTGPTPRHSPMMAYDVLRARTVLFGGFDQASLPGPANDTWEWDGVAWQQRFPSASPAPRWDPVMAYDLPRAVTVLVGGASTATGAFVPLREVWEWDGTNWAGGPADVPVVILGRDAMVAHDRLGLLLMHGVNNASATVSMDLWVGTPRVAALSAGGTGCGGAATPHLLAFGPPYLGNRNFAVDIAGGPAAAPALLGLAPGTAPASIGFGCTVYLQGAITTRFAATDANGFTSLSLPIPVDPALLGVEAALQAAVLDAGAPLGFGLTGFVMLRVGE